eukprot:360880-Chlamydomonas_euryale.AAC.3
MPASRTGPHLRPATRRDGHLPPTSRTSICRREPPPSPRPNRPVSLAAPPLLYHMTDTPLDDAPLRCRPEQKPLLQVRV